MASLPPPPVDPGTISARVVGTAGGGTLYYWVVVRYPGGYAVQMLPAVASNAPGVSQLSGSRYVRVRWAPVVGATGYDVLRSNTAAYPAAAGSCACAVVLNTTDNTVDDTGGVLSTFPSAGQLPATGATAGLSLDTASESYPFVNVALVARSYESLRLGLLSGLFAANDCVKWLAGRLVSAGAECGSGSGGTPGGSNTQVQYNNAGAFGGAAQMFWDAVNNRLGIMQATPLYPLDVSGNARVSGLIVAGAPGSDCVLAGGTTGACAASIAGLQQEVILDLKPSITTTVLTIHDGRCWGMSKPQATVTITGGSGNGSYVAYCTYSNAIVVETSASAGITVTCVNCLPITVTTPLIPSGFFGIAQGTITSGQWATVVDERDWDTRAFMQAGFGLILSSSANTNSYAVDPAIIQAKADNYTPLAEFDAIAATRTRLKTGTTPPVTCGTGDLFFDSDAAAGQNFYGCTAPNVWTLLGGSSSAVAVHTYLAPVNCNFVDSVVTPMYWQDPKNGVNKPGTGSCSDGTQFGRGTLQWSNSTTQYMFLVFPVPINRTGAVDFSVVGFDLGGSGSFTFDVSKWCSNDSTDWAAAESFTDTQSLSWTSTNTNVVRRTLSGITLPAACTGSDAQWLVLKLTRNNTSTAATPYYMRAAQAVMRSN